MIVLLLTGWNIDLFSAKVKPHQNPCASSDCSWPLKTSAFVFGFAAGRGSVRGATDKPALSGLYPHSSANSLPWLESSSTCAGLFTSGTVDALSPHAAWRAAARPGG